MSKNKIKIGFTGDIAFDEYTTDYYNKPEKIDKKLLDFLNDNDYNVIDLESPVTLHDETEKESLMHKLEPKHVDYIKKIIKNPIAVIANNHMMDYGKQGLLDTLKNLKQKKVEYIGAGKNVAEASKYIVLGNDVKVGVIAIQYKDYYIATEENPGPFHDSYLKLLKQRINEMKSEVDWVVVVYHGGEEFLSVPMPYTKKLLKKILKFGADVIVAHHPHVVQGYEFIGKKAIFYSLGNFIFDTDFQRAQRFTNSGVLLSLEFTKDNFDFDYKLLNIDRKKEKINLYEGKTKFNEISKKKYKKMWVKEAVRIREISNNKKKLRKTRIDKFVSEGKNKMVPFEYFEKKIGTEKLIVSIDKVSLFRRIMRHRYVRLLKECVKNKKYRYYAYAKIRNIFSK
ncbi:MAG: CapA family protein [Bacilli bacterium]|nr:CapA family protein [Bacilli bacterium]